MLQQLYKASAHGATHTASTMQPPNTYNSDTLPAALPHCPQQLTVITHMYKLHTHSATADTKPDKMSRLASGLGPRHHHQAMQPLPSSKTES